PSHTTAPSAAMPSLSAFFFSSRRRHTRSKRDWSSDVCSSDLASAICKDYLRRKYDIPIIAIEPAYKMVNDINKDGKTLVLATKRSEERRVGREGNSRGATTHGREKGGEGGRTGEREEVTSTC